MAAALAVVKEEEDDDPQERNRVGDYVGRYATAASAEEEGLLYARAHPISNWFDYFLAGEGIHG